jgi:wobble nucleotide-excising tRNase
MNTQPAQCFSISARYLGPIFQLDGKLSKHAQNLIFARNGTGKSFLSRAFRYLDQAKQGQDISKSAFFLVSDESPDGKGSFSFSRDANMGGLALERTSNTTNAITSNTIFHVFSEDFVHDELREREYKIDGEIENTIAVDSENIKLKDAQKNLETAAQKADEAYRLLDQKFEAAKLVELCQNAGVSKLLKEFRELRLGKLLESLNELQMPAERTLKDILEDLAKIKLLPSNPEYPSPETRLNLDAIDLEALAKSLRKITSPAAVSEDIKKRIERNIDFYKMGTEIILNDHSEECPFCDQSIAVGDPRLLIDAFIQLFTDEEEKHKDELRTLFSTLRKMEVEINATELRLGKQLTLYDNLKAFVPSLQNSSLSPTDDALKQFRTGIATLKKAILDKVENLAKILDLHSKDFVAGAMNANKIIQENNSKIAALTHAVEKVDDERKLLHRDACAAFEKEIAVALKSEIQAYKDICLEVDTIKLEIDGLQKSSPPINARDRVADTFERLLKEFFAEKYIFDRTRFVLKRGGQDMARGPHRTLSDGEKTAIAFCYFIASTHRKVKANTDYRNLFLVFDDPVTSMSYDYIFSIAQTLKNITISSAGEISTNVATRNYNVSPRPDLLILTHSSYFFNICRTNAVVRPEATFSLHRDGESHKIAFLPNYVAPFEQQLEHVYHVANGKEADHSTANTIRSIIESIGRFCRPDKSQSVESFISFLASEDKISVKSVLINTFCHGTYYEETPSPEDMRLACQETITVVEQFAAGHIELLKEQ